MVTVAEIREGSLSNRNNNKILVRVTCKVT